MCLFAAENLWAAVSIYQSQCQRLSWLVGGDPFGKEIHQCPLNKMIPKAGWDFVCTMLSCSITSRIQGHSDEGQNHLNTHFAAVPFFLSLDFSRKSPRHKQASMQTNKQSSKPCMHTQAVLIRGQTWLNELAAAAAAADAASPRFCHLGNRAKTNRTAGHGSPDAVGATVYRRRPHTASTHKG